jgi:hypothetical protein
VIAALALLPLLQPLAQLLDLAQQALVVNGGQETRVFGGEEAVLI